MEIKPQEIKSNVFRLIDSDWMLIAAGTFRHHNMMTASWGGLGVLWNKPVTFCFVRPTRHTYRLMEENDSYTLSFFTERYRPVLNYCGSHSGRDVDKTKETGLTPVAGRPGWVFFAEARMVLECRKLYYQDLNPEAFLNPRILGLYPQRDFHRMYIGEIRHCLIKGTMNDER
jgi:flavin reductase (DIM6/NTAB) family NADH-FMN oxidoreductase RutF